MNTIVEIFKCIGICILMLFALVGILFCIVGLTLASVMIAICIYHLAITLNAPEGLAQAISVAIVVLMIIGMYDIIKNDPRKK